MVTLISWHKIFSYFLIDAFAVCRIICGLACIWFDVVGRFIFISFFQEIGAHSIVSVDNCSGVDALIFFICLLPFEMIICRGETFCFGGADLET